MTKLTADDILRIWRDAKNKFNYQRTKQEQEDALADLEDIMEAETEDDFE
tara:strand:- start:943 stop:1092 length:150 start_codon:yes stop_codon:yes gene_type:complete